MPRPVAALAVLALALLAACADPTRDLAEPLEPLGNFRAGHLEVVSSGPKPLLVTQTIDDATWTAEIGAALDQRFSRFEGDRYYHLGVKVWEYSVPPPVIPGKSALHLLVTVWDDATQTKLNAEPESIVVIKVFESRITQTTEARVTALAEEAAREIEKWLRKQQAEEGWFGGLPDATAAPQAGTVPPADTVPPVETAAAAAP